MTEPTEPAASQHRPPPGAILLIPVAVALVLTLFSWPNARLEPRDLPIGVAGPPAVSQAVGQRLAEREGAFDVHTYGDEAAAVDAIEDREIYGAFVATRGGVKVLTASGASQAVAQLIGRAASELPAAGRAGAVEVRDVVPAPRGAALASSVLPLVLAGLLTGILATLIGAGALQRTGLIVVGSLLAGLTATVLVQSWLEVVEGSWLANAAVLSLTVMAIAAFVAGLAALFGTAGLIAAALVMVLVGNPFSAVGSAPELLPEPVGAIGQLMPPGAGGNLLRSTGFFDGADAGGHIVVLVVWVLAGLVCLALAGSRDRRPVPAGATAA